MHVTGEGVRNHIAQSLHQKPFKNSCTKYIQKSKSDLTDLNFVLLFYISAALRPTSEGVIPLAHEHNVFFLKRMPNTLGPIKRAQWELHCVISVRKKTLDQRCLDEALHQLARACAHVHQQRTWIPSYSLQLILCKYIYVFIHICIYKYIFYDFFGGPACRPQGHENFAQSGRWFATSTICIRRPCFQPARAVKAMWELESM